MKPKEVPLDTDIGSDIDDALALLLLLVPGRPYDADPSHNVRCDIEAARRVFASGMPISVLTNDVTTRVWWDGATVAQLLSAGDPPETEAVARLLRVWLDYRSDIFERPITGTCPHDPLTVAEAVFPKKFVRYATGRMSVNADGSTQFVPDPGGPHQAAVRVDTDRFLSWMAPRLLASEQAEV